MGKLDAVLRVIDAISENAGKLFSWSMLIVVFITLYEVIMRYLFNNPTEWAFEVTYMLWGAYFVMVAAWTHKAGGHVSMDVIYNRFPRRMRLTLDLVFCLVLCLPWIAALIMGGTEFAIDSWRIKEHTVTPWRPPIYPLKTVLPIAFALLGLQAVARFIRDLTALTRGKV